MMAQRNALKFLVYHNGELATDDPLGFAYLVGSDNNAVRGEIVLDGGMIVCRKRETGVAALALQRDVGNCGQMVVQTCLLPEREEPYLLSLELARHRLLLLYNKLEDWSMFESGKEQRANKGLDQARDLFIEALGCQNEPAQADRLAQQSLVAAIAGSEQLALTHADLLLTRRKATDAIPKWPVGCGVSLNQHIDDVRTGLFSNIDFFSLLTRWRVLAPSEGEYRWDAMDRWAQCIDRHKVHAIAGPIVSFQPKTVPDWLYIWDDFDTIRDLVYEHTERMVTRYKNVFGAWNVVSGLHVNNGHIIFNFEQLMELTRMTTILVKKITPQSKALVEITQPFGEYYADNQRSIPPLMYANLLVQSAVQFDGFILKLLMGQSAPGQHTRDLMQISHFLDQFLSFGKPVTVIVAAPSGVWEHPNPRKNAQGGYWREPWSEQTQGGWLESVFKIALSKPFVDAVAWYELVDRPDIELPMAGLISGNLHPKQAFKRLAAFRRGLFDTPDPHADATPRPDGRVLPPNGN